MSARVLFCLTAVLVVVNCANNCVPDQRDFYWTSPCDNQGFTNVLVPSSVYAQQNGVPINKLGGIDATTNLTLFMNISNYYNKTINGPKIDLTIQDYSEFFGKCKWINIPTLGTTENMDGCKMLANCHLNSPPNPNYLVFTINLKSIGGVFESVLDVGTYYGISLTLKDSKDKLLCIYFQDKLIKV